MKIKAFTSDQHFGHEPIIRFCNRPFYSVEHMSEELIKRYNSVIGKDDTVVWVGDAFFLKRELINAVMKEMNGRKILVRGNHDKGIGTLYHDFGFDMVIDNHMMIEIENTNVKICHYPYAGAKTEFYDKYADIRPIPVNNEVLIHGHTHQTEKRKGNMIHVGVDAWNYTPVLFEEVVSMINEIKNERPINGV